MQPVPTGLSKDDFDAFMELELLPTAASKPAISAASTAAKSALTRKYNQAHKGFKKVGSSKGGGGADGMGTRLPGEEGDEGDEGGDATDEDDEEEEYKPKPAAQPKPAGKGKGKARA